MPAAFVKSDSFSFSEEADVRAVTEDVSKLFEVEAVGPRPGVTF